MERKLSVDAQLLTCAQEDLAIKKKLVEQMDTFEKQYSETMTKRLDNMEKLTNSISEGFSILKHFMIPPPPTPYAYQGNHINFLQCIVNHLQTVTVGLLFLNLSTLILHNDQFHIYLLTEHRNHLFQIKTNTIIFIYIIV